MWEVRNVIAAGFLAFAYIGVTIGHYTKYTPAGGQEVTRKRHVPAVLNETPFYSLIMKFVQSIYMRNVTCYSQTY